MWNYVYTVKHLISAALKFGEFKILIYLRSLILTVSQLNVLYNYLRFSLGLFLKEKNFPYKHFILQTVSKSYKNHIKIIDL